MQNPTEEEIIAFASQMYPTLEEVNAAGWEQLYIWLHELPMPGSAVLMAPDEIYDKVVEIQAPIMLRIRNRINEFKNPPNLNDKINGNNSGSYSSLQEKN